MPWSFGALPRSSASARRAGLPSAVFRSPFVRAGKVVARIVTGKDGHARASLAPGVYVVRAAPGVPLLPGHKSRQVKVTSGRMTKVTLPLGVKTSGGSGGPGQ